jgi:anti-repressor protein
MGDEEREIANTRPGVTMPRVSPPPSSGGFSKLSEVIMTTDLVSLKDGKPITTSFIVAESFGKRHDHVLRDIDRIINSEAYRKRSLPNFGQTPYIHPQNGQTYRMFEMDRQGFEILAMGFTGEKALEWKLKYSDAFAMMESTLTQTVNLPKSKAEALFLAAEQARIIEEQEAKLAEQEPKVLLYDQLADSHGLISVSDVLGMLKGRTGQDYKMADLKLFLRKAGFVYWQKEFQPTVKAIDAGWFAIRYEERRYGGETHMIPEWAVTAKGFLAIWNVVAQPQRRYGALPVQMLLSAAQQEQHQEAA